MSDRPQQNKIGTRYQYRGMCWCVLRQRRQPLSRAWQCLDPRQSQSGPGRLSYYSPRFPVYRPEPEVPPPHPQTLSVGLTTKGQQCSYFKWSETSKLVNKTFNSRL